MTRRKNNIKTITGLREEKRLTIYESGIDGGWGYVTLHKYANIIPKVIFSTGGGWDHVSVSFENRCPKWEEMCRIKNIFFYPDECVIQYHPPNGDYINQHPYVLHLWRPQSEAIPMPPKVMV